MNERVRRLERLFQHPRPVGQGGKKKKRKKEKALWGKIRHTHTFIPFTQLPRTASSVQPPPSRHPPPCRTVSVFKENPCLALSWDLQFSSYSQKKKKKKYPKHSKQQQCITYQPLQTEDTSERQQGSFFPTVLHYEGGFYLIAGISCAPVYMLIELNSLETAAA